MNALAMAVSPAQAQAAAADARQYSGKQAGGGFAETLLHFMGGTGAESVKGAQHFALPQGWFGLAGLLQWNGGAEKDLSAEGLLKLIGNLAEKLGLLDDAGQIPSDLQQQLAALFAQVQELLEMAENGGVLLAETPQVLEPVLSQNAPAATDRPVHPQELSQALRKLADHIAQGLLTREQAGALAEPVRQAMRSLKAFAEIQQPPALHSALKAAAQESGPAPEAYRAMMAPAPNEGEGHSDVQAGMRWQIYSRPAAAEQGWAYGKAQTVLTAENPFQAAMMAQEAEAAESAPAGNPVPVWTLLKDSQQAVPPAGASNAQEQLPQSVPIRQFVQEMGKYLVKQFVLTQGNGVSEAKISLHPEHLGQLDIRIVIQNGVLTAKFVAETGAAREILEAQMAQLRTALQGQGLQVERMEVVQQQPSLSYASQTGSHHGQHGTGHNSGGTKKGNRGGYDENAAFEAELERTAYLRDFGYGGRLNVTA